MMEHSRTHAGQAIRRYAASPMRGGMMADRGGQDWGES